MWIFLFLVAVPILEIALFIQVGGWLGLLPTILIVILTALVGTILLRTQGLQTLANLQSSVSTGRNPMDPIAHGAFILIAGVLLLTPGFFTDGLGLLFLIPTVRRFLISNIGSRIAQRATVQTFGMPPHQQQQSQQSRQDPDIVEADFEVVDEPNAEPGTSKWTQGRGPSSD